MENWKDANDVVYDVAYKVRKLCNTSMNELRLLAISDPERTLNAARIKFKGASKGELVELFLTDEYIEDISSKLFEEE